MSTGTTSTAQDVVGSSPELSTPPMSPDPEMAPSPAINLSTNANANSHNNSLDAKFGGGEKVAPTITNKVNSATPSAKEKKVTSRKSKETATNASESKAAKPRKPRTASTTTGSTRKKQKISEHKDSSADSKPAQSSSRQSEITDLVGPSQDHPDFGVPQSSTPAQIGNSDIIPQPSLSFVGAGQATPRSSGQNYDPIRSATIESAPPHSTFNVPPVSPTSARVINRASESPSIASLIDHPTNLTSTHTFSPASRPQSNDRGLSGLAQPSPSTIQVQPPPAPFSIATTSPPPTGATYKTAGLDVDRACTPPKAAVTGAAKKGTAGTSTGSSSTAQSPKPIRQKEVPPPLPQGAGLLSSTLFGGAGSLAAEGPQKTAPTIILNIPMKGETNQTINFARMAEARYGFNALHPRLAAQRERLARVAAAGAAIEKASGSGSADEMSLDLSEPESNVEMGGMDGASEGGDKKQKRKPKTDSYDKEDPFVDDSEMLWEEQAAATKGGFFVWSGPLVPEGEKPSIERADGTVKRGRGRGRGGSTRGGSTRGAAAGGGTTSIRGSTTQRKPRVTKAARAIMEQEKLEREKMAVLAAKPSTYPT
ncbi:MAG: hypothetical protein M1827_000278 [Pycnora praestabilis]|nr:MAG: hypothetical protein M1827_000278 [Pycnora praestabilis]